MARPLLALALVVHGAHGRTVVSLDDGWRFFLEYSGTGCPAERETPVSLAGHRCPGLKQQGRPEDGGPATAEQCRVACCRDSSCNVWQFCPAGSDCHQSGPPCWIGAFANATTGGCAPSPGWQGGARAAPPASPEPPLSPCRLPQCSPTFDDSSWRVQDVPHDFVVEGAPTPSGDKAHGYLPYGVGWYRREITIDKNATMSSIWLDFEGVMVSSKVWLNGVLCGSHSSGYTPFRCELGVGSNMNQHLNFGGKNVLAVQVDATAPDGWWYDGGGIYRHVWLTFANSVHVSQDNWGVYVPSSPVGDIRQDASGPDGALVADADVRPSVEVAGGVYMTSIRISCELRSADGAAVGRAQSKELSFAPWGSAIISLPPVHLRSARLWTLQQPALYTALVEVTETYSNKTLDSVEVTFGIRSANWSASEGFSLNGVPTKILGTANHQDFPAVGVAVPDELQEHRLRSIQDLGGNAWRTAHNPPNEALLDAADRLGVLVWDENHRNGQVEEMEALVKRDRNHPSVIIWSICNEALCTTDNDREDAKKLKAAAKWLDPGMDRVVSANQNGWLGPDTVLDVQGFDYASGNYDAWHARAPQVPAISSETSSAVSDRGEYANDPAAGHVAGFDLYAPSWGDTAQVAWSRIMERPFIAGGFTWTGWDYRGEPTPDAWPDVNSHFGILDAAGFWKDRAFWYQAWWARPSPPVLHVFPHWNWSPDTCVGACTKSADGLHVDVWAYSNADEVELFHPNGTSLGRRPMANYSHVEWKAVPYAPGSLRATAYTGGQKAAESVVETTGPASSLRLSFQRGVGSRGLAAGRGVALVVAEVVDGSGRVVPTASSNVTFSAEGLSVLGTSNGDPACLAKGASPARRAFHGLVLAVVKAGQTPGDFHVTATAPGLAPAEPLLVHVLKGEFADSNVMMV